MSTLPLKRTATGYVTRDGRFTITRTTMGQGVNNVGGWSNGRTAWNIQDTTGATRFGGTRGTGPVRDWDTVDTLSDVRDLITYVHNREIAR